MGSTPYLPAWELEPIHCAEFCVHGRKAEAVPSIAPSELLFREKKNTAVLHNVLMI